MFTGLVESVGTLLDVVRAPETIRLRVGTEIAGDTTLGESIAVNGVCLTVVDNASGAVSFDISPETARVTTIGDLETAALVNLERSMRADARVGGHFVQGHVDATGTIAAIRQEGDYYRVTVAIPASLMPLLVQKGSIAVDGVSLTVASIDDGRSQFDVQLIPFTWLHTRFQSCREGTAVNIECDILGKYVVRALGLRPDAGDLRTAMNAFGPDGRSR
jgi:riboflavin synthase alpha subunit